jgi:hypothetical protein
MFLGAAEIVIGSTAAAGGSVGVFVFAPTVVGSVASAGVAEAGVVLATHGLGNGFSGAYNLGETLSGGRSSSNPIRPGDEIGGAKMTKHATEQLNKRGLTTGQIENALKNGERYYDSKNGTDLWVIGNSGSKGGYTVVTNTAKDTIVTVENFVPNIATQEGTRFIKY